MPDSKFWNMLLATYLLYVPGDISSTLAFIYTSNGVEANPLMAWLMNHSLAGWMTILLIKVYVFVLIVGLIWALNHYKYQMISKAFLYAVAVISLGVLISNLMLVLGQS